MRRARLPGSLAVLVGLVAVGFGGPILVAGLAGELFGRVPAPSGMIRAEAPAVAVIDGDTLRLQGTVIRLQGVQAPRRGVTCRARDGTGYDCGGAAAAALGQLVRGQPVACRLDGRDGHGLPQGTCDAGGTAVNRAIVAAGWARAADPDSASGTGDASLVEEERQARTAMRGVWRAADAPSF